MKNGFVRAFTIFLATSVVGGAFISGWQSSSPEGASHGSAIIGLLLGFAVAVADWWFTRDPLRGGADRLSQEREVSGVDLDRIARMAVRAQSDSTTSINQTVGMGAPELSTAVAHHIPQCSNDSDKQDAVEIDMADADDVARVQACRDPALWHTATMAALAYRGDRHGFLHWVLQQPEMDRATAGWIFLWAEGSRYLRGETDFPLNNLASSRVVELFRAVCDRSQGMSFTNDNLGLDPDFEAERLKCLAVMENGELAPGIIAPIALLAKPYNPAGHDNRFTLDDGIIVSEGLF